MTRDQREIHRKKRIIEYAERSGNVNKTCRYFGRSRPALFPSASGSRTDNLRNTCGGPRMCAVQWVAAANSKWLRRLDMD